MKDDEVNDKENHCSSIMSVIMIGIIGSIRRAHRRSRDKVEALVRESERAHALIMC